MKQFLVSNPGVAAVVINDLGAISIAAAASNIDLVKSFNTEHLRDSADLRQAIVDGKLTGILQPDNYAVNSGATFDNCFNDLNQSQVETLMGLAGQEASHDVGTNKASLDQDLPRVGGSPTNLSPFIMAFAAKLSALIISSKKNQNATYTIAILKNDVEVATQTITAGTGGTYTPVNITVALNDNIRYRVKTIATEVNNLEVVATWKQII